MQKKLLCEKLLIYTLIPDCPARSLVDGEAQQISCSQKRIVKRIFLAAMITLQSDIKLSTTGLSDYMLDYSQGMK